jgi:uncharacterized protein YqcC (DUF446 family)
MNEYHVLESTLIDLETAMRTLCLWSEECPDPECFESELPFFVDRLSFQQWLQFVLIPKCYQLITLRQALSIGAQITPMAETIFTKTQVNKPLFSALESLDSILK